MEGTICLVSLARLSYESLASETTICLSGNEFDMLRQRQIYAHSYTRVLVFDNRSKWLVVDLI